jgi:hypothetical protein
MRRLRTGPNLRRGGAGVVAMGLEASAYVADTPHDLVVAMQTGTKYRSTRSAAELEGWLREAWPLDEIRERPPEAIDRTRFDEAGRLLALWILEHWERHPEDLAPGLSQTTIRQLRTQHPDVDQLLNSTARNVWALGAARRVVDAHQVG